MFRPLQGHHQGGCVKRMQLHQITLRMCVHMIYLYYFVYSFTDDIFEDETYRRNIIVVKRLLLIVQIVRFRSEFVIHNFCNIMMKEICLKFF
jgi:hypothetical protein